MIEYVDMVGVTCDGRTATIDFSLWDNQEMVTVRAIYFLGGSLEVLTSPSERLAQYVRASEECKADARELVMVQRDLNREKN